LLPFSKKGSKKIELPLLLLILLVSPLQGQSLRISVEPFPSESTLKVDCAVVDAPEDQLWESVEEGFQVEVTYTLRLYKRSTGIFRFLGDRIVEDAEPTRTGEYDPFTRLYVIHDTGTGKSLRTDTRRDFLSELLHIEDVRFEIPREEASYYILASAEISPVKLKPPLTILSIFSKRNRYVTDWHETALPAEEVSP
jgi:hypothetical protein